MPTDVQKIQMRTENQEIHYLVGEWPQTVGFTPEFLGLAESRVIETIVTVTLENGTARYLIVDWRDGALIAERICDVSG